MPALPNDPTFRFVYKIAECVKHEKDRQRNGGGATYQDASAKIYAYTDALRIFAECIGEAEFDKLIKRAESLLEVVGSI